MEKHDTYPHIFEPGRIGGLTVRNRIVMAPLATNYASETGSITDIMFDYYTARAKGGTGLIIMENCSVDYPMGKAGATQLRLDDDRFIPGMSRLVDALHFHGAAAAIQINHSGPSGAPGKTQGKGPVGASSITYAPNLPIPRALSIEEIEVIIEKFAQAALRAKKAGFDAVEIHGGHAYLIAHFLSPLTNHRTDEYGDGLEGRLRLPTRVIRRVRELVGDKYPVMFRISGDECIEGGRGIEESMQVASLLAAEGLAAIHVSSGTHSANYPSGAATIEPMAYEQGWKVHLAEQIKKAAGIPVIAVGVVRDPAFAEQILAEGRADFVAMGRGLVADPEWVNKARSGMESSIRKCISCNEGCIRRRGFMDLPIRCSVNAEAGRPVRFRAARIEGKPKRVLVVGGGPAGMEAARVLKLRGHDVTLWEKKGVLGGQLVFASIPPIKAKLRWIMEYLRHQMEELSIPYELNREATERSVLEFGPDEVVVAAGAAPLAPPIPGIGDCGLQTIEDVLVDDYQGLGANVAVMGGGGKGAETALFLAERGATVTLVEMLNELIGDFEPITRMDLTARLEKAKVRLLTGTRILSCRPDGLNAVNPSGETIFIPAERLVLSLGYRPERGLADALQGKVGRVYAVGDCLMPRKVIDAISEAYDAAVQV